MSALNICNGCDVNDADPKSTAGYCAECEAEASKEPYPHPRLGVLHLSDRMDIGKLASRVEANARRADR